MSAHQTWLGRSTATPRSRYGNILCPGAGLLVRGFGPSAAMPIFRINRCTRLRLVPVAAILRVAAQPATDEARRKARGNGPVALPNALHQSRLRTTRTRGDDQI